jgi:hypothetical protein
MGKKQMSIHTRRRRQRIVFCLLASIFCLFSIFPSPLFAASVRGWGFTAINSSALRSASIAAGGSYSLALKSNGSIIGWGYNNSGQATPPAGNNFVAVAAGGYHSLALKSDGSIAGWGRNYYGQAAPPSGNNFNAISAGTYHSPALYVTSFFDLSVFGNQWKQPCSSPSWCRGYDFDKTGFVDIYDLQKFSCLWLAGL